MTSLDSPRYTSWKISRTPWATDFLTKFKWGNFHKQKNTFQLPPSTLGYHSNAQSWRVLLNNIFRQFSSKSSPELFFLLFHEKCTSWNMLWKIWAWHSAWWRPGDNFQKNFTWMDSEKGNTFLPGRGGGGGGGGFRLKPHIEVRFKWMWRDQGGLSKRRERQNGVQVSLPTCAHIMVTRARFACGANKKMAHDQLALYFESSSCRGGGGGRWGTKPGWDRVRADCCAGVLPLGWLLAC